MLYIYVYQESMKCQSACAATRVPNTSSPTMVETDRHILICGDNQINQFCIWSVHVCGQHLLGDERDNAAAAAATTAAATWFVERDSESAYT